MGDKVPNIVLQPVQLTAPVAFHDVRVTTRRNGWWDRKYYKNNWNHPCCGHIFCLNTWFETKLSIFKTVCLRNIGSKYLHIDTEDALKPSTQPPALGLFHVSSSVHVSYPLLLRMASNGSKRFAANHRSSTNPETSRDYESMINTLFWRPSR